LSGGFFAEEDIDTTYFSRVDSEEYFGTFSLHPFRLEDKVWPTVEHYYQAMKFEDLNYQEIIRLAETPKKARKLGRRRFKRLRKDWKKVKLLYMTRAVYTKCCTHPNITTRLLTTNNTRLVENSLYDYYWGCGRDRRGKNTYGQILMNVRKKLTDERGN
jgi:ribA/ribD-fused uncharacterized protein